MLRFIEVVITQGHLADRMKGQPKPTGSKANAVPISHTFWKTLVRGLMDKISQLQFYSDDFNHKEDLFSNQMLNI